jgi:hypothetical protein
MVTLPKETRLAILIDAENMSAAWVGPVLSRLQSPKVITLKRAYGDWSKAQLNGWKPVLSEYGIHPVHAPTYVAGKNSADMMLTIDAITLLHQQVGWFCIVSNDSDFTPLVHHLTGAGAKVVGFGSHQVSQAFANACHKFVYLKPMSKLQPTVLPVVERVGASAGSKMGDKLDEGVGVEPVTPVLSTRAELLQWLQKVYASFAEPNAWIDLGRFGSELRKQYPGFDHKLFGYSALGKLIAIEGGHLFELRRRPIDPTHPQHLILQVRLRQSTTSSSFTSYPNASADSGSA